MLVKDNPEEGLKKQLEEACKDLWWSSESDYPVEVVWQPAVEIGAGAAAIDDWVSALYPNTEIEKVNLNNFFERAIAPKSWHTEEDKAQQTRLRQLREFLAAELSELQVYRCGEVEIKAYVLGRSTDDVLAGVRTVIVET